MRKAEKDRLEKKKQRVEESNQKGLPEDRDEGIRVVASYVRMFVHKLLAGLYPGAPFRVFLKSGARTRPTVCLSRICSLQKPNKECSASFRCRQLVWSSERSGTILICVVNRPMPLSSDLLFLCMALIQ